MKKIFLFVTLYLLISCNNDIQFDGGTRYAVQSKLVDNNNNPIVGQPVLIEVYDDYSSDIIATGVSDANGNFSLTYPKPSSQNVLTKIIIPENNNFLEKEIFNIKQSNFLLYKCKVNSIKLSKISEIVELSIKFQSSFQGNYLDNLVLTGDIYIKEQDFSPSPTQQNYNFFNGKKYLLSQNQTVNIKYRKVNVSTIPSVITSVNENVLIGSTNQTLTIIN